VTVGSEPDGGAKHEDVEKGGTTPTSENEDRYVTGLKLVLILV
jgi:hypothetical protein